MEELTTVVKETSTIMIDNGTTAAAILQQQEDVSSSEGGFHGAVPLGIWQMLAVYGIGLLNFGLSVVFHLNLEVKLLEGFTRSTLQLLFLGYILKPIFDNDSFLLVLGYAFFMMTVAAQTAYHRPKYEYPGMFLNIFTAISMSASSVMLYAMFLIVQVKPWWEAQYLIPLSGMILGNTLNSVTLSMNVAVTEIAEGYAKLELYIAHGASRWEACRPVFIKAMQTAIMPNLNSLCVIGLVSIPGMMTGQILGGNAPERAALYQIMVAVLNCTTSMAAGVIGTHLTILSSFDEHGTLHRSRLAKRHEKSNGSQLISSFLGWLWDKMSWCCHCCGLGTPRSENKDLMTKRGHQIKAEDTHPFLSAA